MDKWSEYQEYMQTDTIKIENQCNDLILYRGFCTLTWCNQYFLVLKDNILLMGEEFPYGEYETAKEVYDILAPDLAAQPSKTNNGKKFKYKISFDSAEGITEGMVSLTADEAKIVEYAMDTDNWSEFESDAYGAGGSIDIDHPSEETGSERKQSFVDELNPPVSESELINEENRLIEFYTKKILGALKYSCKKNKMKHSLSGYYGREAYMEVDEIVSRENAYQFKDNFRLDTESKKLDLSKLKQNLSKEIANLGFTEYQVVIDPVPVSWKTPIGTGFFGDTKYRYNKRTDFIVWLSLKW